MTEPAMTPGEAAPLADAADASPGRGAEGGASVDRIE
jgi:hypothetical protein